jgi:hypothetical protein
LLLTRDSSHKKINTDLESKGGKKDFQTNGAHKQAGVAIFISDKINFRLKINQK